mgnify:CR=1 FL=1
MVCDTFGKNRETKSIDDSMVVKFDRIKYCGNMYGLILFVTLDTIKFMVFTIKIILTPNSS